MYNCKDRKKNEEQAIRRFFSFKDFTNWPFYSYPIWKNTGQDFIFS